MTNRIMELADAYALETSRRGLHSYNAWEARGTLRAEVDSLTAELQEQARVNGMGGEREAALMAKVEQLTLKNEDHIQQLRKEQLTVQELYSERNFCPRCGKRLVGDGIHTCTPPHNIETDPAKIRAAFEGDDE